MMSDVKATIFHNGPIVIQGKISLNDADGHPYPGVGEKVALCRCGHSEKKPFCDGSHSKKGFQHQAVAPKA